MDAIRQLNIKLDVLIATIETSTDQALSDIKEAINAVQDTDAKRYRTLLATLHSTQLLATSLVNKTGEIEYAAAMSTRICEATKAVGVFLLPKGSLENHLPSYTGLPYSVPDKAKIPTFETERDFILRRG